MVEEAFTDDVTSRAGDGPLEVHANWGDLLRNLEGGEGYRPYKDEALLRRIT